MGIDFCTASPYQYLGRIVVLDVGPNGSNEFATGNPLVNAAIKRLRDKNDVRFLDIEDTIVVQAHIEKQMSERLKEHAEFVRLQQESEIRHKQRMDEFDDRLSAIFSFLDQQVRRSS